jgi:hypothetical protein
MSSGVGWRHKLADAESACKAALDSPALRIITEQTRAGPASTLCEPHACYAALERVSGDPGSTAALDSIKRFLSAPLYTFEQWLLIQAAFVGMKRVAEMPVFDDVKTAWAEEAKFVAQPAPPWFSAFSLDHVRFREMARIITWRRFPAGQFHWEVSGLPRSTLLKAPAKDLPRIVTYWMRELRGFAPFWETHVNDRRKNRLTLTQAEGVKSYYRIARSIEMQPDVKGLVTFGWLYCPSTGQVTPRLAWLRDFFVQNGAVVTPIGLAPNDAGFLVGSEERRRLYEEGRYQPTMTCVLWSRRAMLEWASLHAASGQLNE